ncbi:MAG: phosphoribosylformylglycinamidine synthase subunit PurL [Bacteroidetes bacterium]|jgi:phosphoribosylformylglycinamidine synthase subunit PurL|nr:phosphoribosylformylglycinamidine synthase subunit PurL [Bacteroidota bacterium]MDA0980109.1 phosphoribosylformylglycinamidine synthase subunit PurL [Bacteroidota bacterium]
MPTMTASTAPSTLIQAQDMGLTPDEFKSIEKILGRVPNFTEMCIYSVMWSEHCSYKNSIKWLKTLPKDGDQMLVKAGEENAGIIDLGDGIGCAFKIESHNHPSAIEPYQGAATGVGGINRDIFTMGARPIAQLNSLRFGDPEHPRTKWLLEGVVKGIGDYGNSFGIPVVGGEVFFDPCYQVNPLVNAMSVGLLDVNEIISATAKGPGNAVYIVGSDTGKDGIQGASFASKDITAESADDLPSVQVGDPFQEKLLMEASLELAKTDAIIGMQDMGAAGITCSTSEMSAAGNVGMDIYLDRVPLRQADMEPFEILLSESQERMLVVVAPGKEKLVEDIFKKWDLHAVPIGEVTEGDTINFFVANEIVAQVPASTLVLGGGAPVYEREYSEPSWFAESQAFNPDSVAVPSLKKALEIATDIICLPNIASKKWVWEQYDSMVGTLNRTTNRPSDAGVVSVRGSKKGLALTVDCNSRYVQADPEVGTAIAVAEAARNISCTGATPSAITNCLNFGNPYNTEVYWQFVGAIKGMTRACEKFKTPVTGGNVSFYNQTANEDGTSTSVFPTPTIGMVGILQDRDKHMSLDFKEKGELIFHLGEMSDCINSSEYLANIVGVKQSPAPKFNLTQEEALHVCIRELIAKNLVTAAHDISDGGLFTTLLEMSMPNLFGFDIVSDDELRIDGFLFGEAQGRIIVTLTEEDQDDFFDICDANKVGAVLLGHVTKGKIVVDEEHVGFCSELRAYYDNGFEEALDL